MSHLRDFLADVDCTGLELCETREGEVNIRIDGVPIHSSYSARKEIARLLERVDLTQIKVVYCFGVGAGHLYLFLKPWLESDPSNYLVFLEDDRRVLRQLIDRDLGSEIEDNTQVRLDYVGGPAEDQELLCQQLAQDYITLPFKVIGLGSYARHKPELWGSLQTWLMHSSAMLNFASSEFLNFGATFFRNYYRNTYFIPGSHRVKGLYGAFKGVPAIICGAGPSLNKNFDLLKTLGSRALIFAGGSAIKALCGRGLEPHIGGSVDPNALQYERMNTHSGYEVPMAFKGRVFYRAMRSIHGPRIYLPGNNNYPVSRWMEEQLGIDDPEPHEGYNVLHLLIDLAREMGCYPIVFVGMDLAFTGMQSYASSVVSDAAVSTKEIAGGGDLNNNAFQREDINGEPVYTLWKWVAESEYSSRYAASYPDVTFINATEGGLGFQGIVNLSLQAVKDRYLDRQWDLRAWLHGELQCHKHLCDQASIAVHLGEIRESLERCIEATDKVARVCHDLSSAIDRDKAAEIQLLSKKLEKSQEALAEELAYGQILAPINEVRSILFERKWHEIERGCKSEKERLSQHFTSQMEEVHTLRHAAQLNKLLIDQVIEEAQLTPDNVSVAPGLCQLEALGTMPEELSYHYANGKLAACSHWKEDKREGLTDLYYPSGQVYAHLNYREGLPEAKQEYYYESGQLKTEVFYVAGQIHGTARLWYANGQLKKQVDYSHGTLHGEHREWTEEGLVLTALDFESGKLVRECYWRDKILVEEKFHHPGSSLCDWIKWDERGTLRFEQRFSDERFEQREWDDKGELQRELGGFWNGQQAVIDRLKKGELKDTEFQRFQPAP